MGLYTPITPSWYDGKAGLVLDSLVLLGSMATTIAGTVMYANPEDEEDDDSDELNYQMYDVDIPLIVVGVFFLILSLFLFHLRHLRVSHLKKMGFQEHKDPTGDVYFDRDGGRRYGNTYPSQTRMDPLGNRPVPVNPLQHTYQTVPNPSYMGHDQPNPTSIAVPGQGYSEQPPYGPNPYPGYRYDPHGHSFPSQGFHPPPIQGPSSFPNPFEPQRPYANHGAGYPASNPV